MPLFGMTRGHIGLDIGTSAVRAAEVRGGGRTPQVVRFGQVLLPQGAVVDGEVREPEPVADAVTALWKRAGFTSKRVRLGVANRRVVVRQLELPAMSRDDLESAIRFQAQEYIPIPLAEAVMDFEVLDEFTNAEGQPVQRVLVVAAERGMVDPLLEAAQRAKLDPVVLELNAYPLIRALGGEGPLAAEVEAIIDVGGGVTNVVIHQGGKIRFTRILPSLGGNDFTAAVAESLGLDWEEAEALKHRASAAMGGLQTPFERRPHLGEGRDEAPADQAEPPEDSEEPEKAEEPEDFFADLREPAGEPEEADEEPEEEPQPPRAPDEPRESAFDDDAVARAVDVLGTVTHRFAAEIRGSVDFYTTQTGSMDLTRVVVTGGGALLGGLVEQVGQALRVEAEPGRVFDRVPVGKVKLGPDQISIAEPFLAVAVGLALGGLED